ncbi:hypothetical protein [Corynebacterium lowii]|uniref:hypothetical protein n=1 Tax=Corynebacterium lowii TaxID=1544413 RepID=UPI0012E1D887|nr:hypothetical protein [Corynebacterium lowii]MDP9850565.1 hypothetical protein [Corynebacterium lowii]
MKSALVYVGGLLLGLLVSWLSLLLSLNILLVGVAVYIAFVVGSGVIVRKVADSASLAAWLWGVATAFVIAVCWIMFVVVPFSQGMESM